MFSYYRTETGAKVEIDKTKKEAVISGRNEQQRADAIVLVKKYINGIFKIPTIGFVLLDLDNLNNLITDASKAKFKFEKNHNTRGGKYFVQLQTDPINSFSKNLKIPPPLNGGFTTSRQLNECLSKITSRFLKAVSSDPEKKEFRLKLFFGRELFSIGKEKEEFSINEWIKFRRGKYSTSFHHYSPQFFQKLDKLQKKFGFHEDEVEDKGSVTIYFHQNLRQGKIDLHRNEKGLWEVAKYARNTDRFGKL